MRVHMNDAEHNLHLDQYQDGLVRQEFKCYTKFDGVLRKLTVVRTYNKNGTYHDTSVSETIDMTVL